MSRGELSLNSSRPEKWEAVINALRHNYRFISRLRAIELPRVPEIILIITQDPEESARIVKTCVEQWLDAKSPDVADRLLDFLFDSAAEQLADQPCRAHERLTNPPPHAEGPWTAE